MTITARFASTCSACRRPIAVGESIEWTKGSPARHTACGAAAPTAPTATHPARAYHPTTCRVCGARAQRDSRGYATLKILRSGECVDCYEERKMGY